MGMHKSSALLLIEAVAFRNSNCTSPLDNFWGIGPSQVSYSELYYCSRLNGRYHSVAAQDIDYKSNYLEWWSRGGQQLPQIKTGNGKTIPCITDFRNLSHGFSESQALM